MASSSFPALNSALNPRKQHSGSSSILLSTPRQATRIICKSHASEEVPDLQAVCEAPSRFTGRMPVSSEFGDWRSFRAALVHHQSITEQEYAHEISVVEPGCILLATNSLERHPLLKKSVVLILEVSDGHCRGIILNKQMPFSLEDEEFDEDVVSLSKLGCSSFVSGNLLLHSTPRVQTLSSNKGLRGYQTVINGLYVGDTDTLASTVESLKRGYAEPDQVRICVGDMEWETNQLTAEIRAFNWWKVVSCSSNLLGDVPASGLWSRLHDMCESQSYVSS